MFTVHCIRLKGRRKLTETLQSLSFISPYFNFRFLRENLLFLSVLKIIECNFDLFREYT